MKLDRHFRRLFAAGLFSVAALAGAQPIDRDGDGVPDALDNCVDVPNTNQRDSNNNGFGDACDADINGDGRVNAIDLGLLRAAFATRDAAADVDGNGIVNSLDLALVRRRFGKAPGPSGLPLNSGFVKSPPVARSVEIFNFDKPLADGRNAIVLADFTGGFPRNINDGKAPPTIVVQSEAGLVTINDLGLAGDEKPGDGIYSAVIRFDNERATSDTNAFLARARKSQSVLIGLFNNRELVRTADFNIGNPFLPPPPPRVFTFELPEIGRISVVGTPVLTLPVALPATTDREKTLLVRDPGVVKDPGRTFTPCQANGVVAPVGNPNGAWAFKTLMTNMANQPVTGITPQVFTNDWLKKWLSADATVKHSNGVAAVFPIPARTALQGIVQSLQPGWNPNNPATLDMDKLPFRLLAIVNRLDLAQAGYFGAGEAGELRFVFGLVERQGNSCVASNEMTVIFEYKVPLATCTGLKGLAAQWIALDALGLGTPAYNAALQDLTDDVTLPNAFPGRFNGSAIGQVRTNEVRLALPWELREFTLQASPVHGKLLHETVKNTPDPSQNNSSRINAFLAGGGFDKGSASELGLPLFAGLPFNATAHRYGPGAAPANPPWDGSPALPVATRFEFSHNTCGGCHLNENGTSFTMVKANGALNSALPAALSTFLTGVNNVPDLKYGAPLRNFNDLQRRGQLLDQMAANSCFRFTQFPLLAVPRLLDGPPPFLHDSVFSPPFVH